MFKTRFKTQLTTTPDKSDSLTSKDLATPATQLTNKLAPAKFLKNLNSNEPSVSPPTVANASESKAKKRLYTEAFSFSKYQEEMQTGNDPLPSLDSIKDDIELIPDIISLLEFKPAFDQIAEDETKSNSVNDLLNIQIGLRQLSEGIINRILNKLYSDLELADLINERRKTFTENINDADGKLGLYTELHNKIKRYKDIIDFKNYKTTFKLGNDYINPDFLTVNEYFIKEFGYSNLSIKSFTNTKMILQFLEELYSSAKFYSYNSLVADKKADRSADRGHFSILKETRKNITAAFNGTSLDAVYQALLLLLPKNKIDSIFLISLFLGRECTASYTVNRSDFQTLLESAGIDYTDEVSDDLFYKVIGRPGLDVASTPSNALPNTITAGIIYDEATAEPVLPFENAWITSQDTSKAKFIPGDRFIFEPIMVPENDPATRVGRMQDISNRLDFTIHTEILKSALIGREKGYEIIGDVDVSWKETYNEISLFDEIIKTLQSIKLSHPNSVKSYGNNKIYQGTIDEYIIALFNAAKTDTDLKVKLERFFRPAFVFPTEEQGTPEEPNFNVDSVYFSAFTLSFTAGNDAAALKKTLLNSMIDRILKEKKINFTASPSKSLLDSEKKLLQDLFFNNSGNAGIENSVIIKLYDAVLSIIQGFADSSALAGNTTVFRKIRVQNIWPAVYEIFFNVVTTFLPGIKLEMAPWPPGNKEQLFLINSYDGNSICDSNGSIPYSILYAITTPAGATLSTSNILHDGQLALRNVRKNLLDNRNSIAGSIQLLDFFKKYRGYISEITKFIQDTDNLQFIRDVKQFILDNTDSQANTNVDFTYFNQQQIAVSFKRFMDFTDLINGTAVVPEFKDGKIVPTESNTPPIYKSDIGSRQYIELFRTWLSTSLALRNDSKVLSVGIPYGMSDNLREKIELDDDTNLTGKFKNVNINRGELDLINITVYKEDLEYEDIIFKPKEYTFELSRFVNRDIINNKTTLAAKISKNETNLKASIEQIRDTVLTSDYLSGFNPTFTDIDNEFSSGIKQQLSQKSLDELKINHINSDMLTLYIKLLTGADLQEVNFPAVDNIVYPTVDQELLGLFNLLEDEEDLQTWAQLFTTKTILTDGTRERLELLVPKKYERIFSIIINDDDFPIDEKLTDKSTLATLEQQGIIAERTTTEANTPKTVEKYLNKEKMENISLDRFYVKISTVNDIGIG